MTSETLSLLAPSGSALIIVVAVLLAAWLWWRGGPHKGEPPRE